MKEFLLKPNKDDGPSVAHFRPEILPDMEALFATLGPHFKDRRPFIYMASTERGEGASSIAKAFAYYIAVREGEDCLYVDGNISNPAIKITGDMPDLGLAEYLRGNDDFRMLPFSTELPGLSAVHTGNVKQHYVALSQERARDFRESATRDFRAVVFDGQPGFGKYPEIWAGLADAVLVITSYRSTKESVISRMTTGMNKAGIPIAGLIFNKKKYPVPEFIYRRI
jgi:protein-tyrosine kinase